MLGYGSVVGQGQGLIPVESLLLADLSNGGETGIVGVVVECVDIRRNTAGDDISFFF